MLSVPGASRKSTAVYEPCGLTSVSSLCSITTCDSLFTFQVLHIQLKGLKKKNLHISNSMGGGKGFSQSTAICTSQSDREKFILMSCEANADSIGKLS